MMCATGLGIHIEHTHGPYSDGDTLIHAICDALQFSIPLVKGDGMVTKGNIDATWKVDAKWPRAAHPAEDISIKATTSEKMGCVARRNSYTWFYKILDGSARITVLRLMSSKRYL